MPFANNAANNGTGTTLAVTLPNPVTAGQILVCFVVTGSASAPTVKDSNGNTWSVVQSSGQPALHSFVCYAPLGSSSLTVTATFGSSYQAVIWLGAENLPAAAGGSYIFPASATPTTGTGTTATCNAITFRGTGLDVAAFGSNGTNGGAMTGPAGWAKVYEVTVATLTRGLTIFALAGDQSGSVTPAATFTNSTTWSASALSIAGMPLHGLNTYLEGFNYPNSTALVGTTSPSGSTYSLPVNLAGVSPKITSNHLVSATDGTDAYAITSASTAANDPITFTFYSTPGGSGADHITLMYRVQPDGSCYYCRVNGAGIVSMGRISSGGTFTSLATYNFGSLTGIFTITICPWNFLHEIYLNGYTNQKFFDGYSLANGYAKLPLLSVSDPAANTSNVPTGGFVGIGTNYGSANSYPLYFVMVSAGPRIMMAPDLGCKFVSDRKARMNCKPIQGGLAPWTYTLNRQIGSGAFSAVANPTPSSANGQIGTYLDRNVSASTSYGYQLVVRDANGLAVTSPTVAVTTRATETVTPFVPATANLVGQITNFQYPDPLSADGVTVFGCRPNRVYWSDRYECYFMIGVAGFGNEVTQIFSSTDLINWTPLSNNPQWGLTIAGTTYAIQNSQSLIEHPTDGTYYATAHVRDAGFDGWVFVWNAPTPNGPWTSIAQKVLPNGATVGDNNSHIDYDGTIRQYCASISGGTASVVCRWAANMLSFSGPNNASPSSREGCGPLRWGRQFLETGSWETEWYPNANALQFIGNPDMGSTGNVAGFDWGYPNQTLFTTPAQPLAAPAGSAGTYHDGYGGSIQAADGWANPPGVYEGGTAPGISPDGSYSTQVVHCLKTQSGAFYWIVTRQDIDGSGAQGVVAWFPLEFDQITGRPSVPFAATLQPSAGTGSTGPPTRTPGGALRWPSTRAFRSRFR